MYGPALADRQKKTVPPRRKALALRTCNTRAYWHMPCSYSLYGFTNGTSGHCAVTPSNAVKHIALISLINGV